MPELVLEGIIPRPSARPPEGHAIFRVPGARGQMSRKTWSPSGQFTTHELVCISIGGGWQVISMPAAACPTSADKGSFRWSFNATATLRSFPAPSEYGTPPHKTFQCVGSYCSSATRSVSRQVSKSYDYPDWSLPTRLRNSRLAPVRLTNVRSTISISYSTLGGGG